MAHKLTRFDYGRVTAYTLAFLLLLPLAANPATAQDIQVSGFVKAENIYDTRQVAQVREGQFALFPLPEAIDEATGKDLNAQDNLLFAAFQSRIKVAGNGTEALGAQLSGVIEADFFGAINSDVNEFRLRHAFVKLAWTKHELLMGQYWSPLFTAAVYPGVINFTTGAPFQPFARFPQVRYTYKPGKLRLIGVLSQQRDAFAEIGGAKLQQQSNLPGVHGHLQYLEGSTALGVGAYAKQIRPTPLSERFNAWAVQAYAKANLGGKAEIRAKATYGDDLADHLMTGGFVTDANGDHACLFLAAGWVDVNTTSKPWAVGLFAGYLTNLGANDPIAVETANARAANLDYLWRLSPRLTYSVGKLRFAAELEATSALFASGFDANYKPVSASSDNAVTNVRGLFAAYYFF